jgi:adenosylcobinamide-GDP ribazoletransferase
MNQETEPAEPPAGGDWWTDTLVAWRVFTSRDFASGVSEREIGRSRRAFPLAGLAIALIAVAAYGLAFWIWADVWASAALATAVTLFVTGARGEIGAAVHAEATARHRDLAGRRAAAKEEPVGYAGIATLAVFLILKLLFLTAIPAGNAAAASLMAAIIGSHAAMGLATAMDEPADPGDTVHGLMGAEGKRDIWLTAALGFAFLLLFLGPKGGIAAIAATIAFGWIATIAVRFQYGGLTLPGLLLVQQVVQAAILGVAIAVA